MRTILTVSLMSFLTLLSLHIKAMKLAPESLEPFKRLVVIRNTTSEFVMVLQQSDPHSPIKSAFVLQPLTTSSPMALQ